MGCQSIGRFRKENDEAIMSNIKLKLGFYYE